MNRWMITRICAVGLLGGVALSLGSCAHNDDMLVIIGAMASQPPDCSVEASGSAKLLLSGIVDRGFGEKYTAVLLVSNQLASRGSKARLRAETSSVTINNAEVRLLADGQSEIGYYSVPASGYIPVGSGEDSGYGAIAIDVMPGSTSVTIPPNTGFVIAEIRVQGTTLGGADVDSNLFRFEIFVVDSSTGNGLVYYPVTDTQGNCDCTGSTSATAAACSPGQDTYIPCCSCKDTKDFCATAP